MCSSDLAGYGGTASRELSREGPDAAEGIHDPVSGLRSLQHKVTKHLTERRVHLQETVSHPSQRGAAWRDVRGSAQERHLCRAESGSASWRERE